MFSSLLFSFYRMVQGYTCNLILLCICVCTTMTHPAPSRHMTRVFDRRIKRLMGIFRCNGWGPGCTQTDMDYQHKIISPKLSQTRGVSWVKSEGGRGGSARLATFEPFFTLTSGKHLTSSLPTSLFKYKGEQPKLYQNSGILVMKWV